jgi:rhodanese-related sulfurtransferase
MHRFLLSSLAAVVLLAAANAASAAAAEFTDISHDDLIKMIAAKQVILLDANGSDSWTKGHIPGALDYQKVKDHLADVLPADKGSLIVAYCGSPQCVAYKAAAEAASELGYTNIKHLREGISGWKDSGAAVEKAPDADK